ncbi:MAG TPA: hypothetical protein VKV20_11835 [Ktedonobacteraceae bacterium]|nr:hypothetical protein [Ktedonobacteraceae bacterium]
MQTIADRSPNNVRSQTRAIAVLAVILFAFAGLISGFAAGAFIHPKTGTTTGNSGSHTGQAAPQKTQTAASTKTIHPSPIYWPQILQEPPGAEKADGTTAYILSIQVVSETKDQKAGPPIHAAGITCKMWLTKNSNVNNDLKMDNYKRLKAVDTLSQPLPGEIAGALNFNDNSSQVQTTNAAGQVTWNYSIANSVGHGQYYLVILADWNGIHYNWYWIGITVIKED